MRPVINDESFLNLERADNCIYCYINDVKTAVTIASVSVIFAKGKKKITKIETNEWMNELYYSVAAKRLDCDNTVHAYTIRYNTMQ